MRTPRRLSAYRPYHSPSVSQHTDPSRGSLRDTKTLNKIPGHTSDVCVILRESQRSNMPVSQHIVKIKNFKTQKKSKCIQEKLGMTIKLLDNKYNMPCGLG